VARAPGTTVDNNSADNARNAQRNCRRRGLSGAGSSRPSSRAARPSRQPYLALLCRRPWRHVRTARELSVASGAWSHRRFDLSLLTLRRSLFALSFGKLEEPYSSTLVSRQANFQRPVHANTTTARRGSAEHRRSHNFLLSADGQLPLSCSPVARVEIEQSADLKLRMGDRIED
jgi:hypothetical protein